MHEIYNKGECEGLLLVDASNAFKQLQKKEIGDEILQKKENNLCTQDIHN